MFRRILVPVDFSRRNLAALRAAARVAGERPAEVTLLHVIERIHEEDSGVLDSFYRKLEISARRRMQELLPAVRGNRLTARGEIVYGKPVIEILRFAETSRSDLIVLSSHKLPLRRSGESWGTISYKVGVLSRCPVLLVK